MARALEQGITDQITAKRIAAELVFKINDVDRTSYLMDYSISYDRSFGSASANFVLANQDGVFGEAGSLTINVGDIVSLSEYFADTTTEWKSFYGRVEQRSVTKQADTRTISLACLDYISIMKYWELDLEIEGTKVEVTEETLTPSYLDSPNDMYAQVFNFANNAIAQRPPPTFTFKDKNNQDEDPQYSGYEMYYDEGQVKFAAPINARDNFDVIAQSYYFYTEALYAEDILRDIITAPNGYNGYLFDETSVQAVIDNHLTTTFLTEEETSTDYLTADPTSSTVTVRTKLAQATVGGDSTIYLTSTSGLPEAGTGNINGDIITWVSLGSGNTLTGVSGVQAHPVDAYFECDRVCAGGSVWYFKYSNIITDLISSDFTIPGANFIYLDKRNGRIIIDAPLSISANVHCDTNYSFSTLQSTGIELNWMEFRPREVENRFEAINKLRNYLAPNYVIRTQGDNKIWASFMHQKTSADYTLNLVKSIDYSEDTDLYTRVVLYGKNKNPRNLALDNGISFSTTGASYKAQANQIELMYDKTENGWHVFKSGLGDAGRIVTNTFLPILYIGGVQVDNKLHQIVFQPIYIEKTQTTETSGGGGGMCYLTTAACEYFGRPDNCHELNMLRKFRDEWLKNQPEGAKLVETYYSVAPKILENISKHSEKDKIYNIMWNKYILPCVSLIEHEMYTETKDLYVQAVMRLMNLDSFVKEEN